MIPVVRLLYVPEGHWVQLNAAVVAPYVPEGQTMHEVPAVDPLRGLYVPKPQGTHAPALVDRDEGLYVPKGQSEQLD